MHTIKDPCIMSQVRTSEEKNRSLAFLVETQNLASLLKRSMAHYAGVFIGIFLCLIGLMASPALAITVPEIMAAIDRQTTFKSDVSAKVQMTQQKATQGTKVIEMVYRRSDKNDSFLIVMTAPESDRGNGYLKSGDNFWMYRQNTRSFQHIGRDESIAGTDASANDFERRTLVESYRPAEGDDAVTSELLGKIPVYRIALIAKQRDVKYPHKLYWVRQDNYLPLKEQLFSLSKTLMQTNYYLKYTQIQGQYIITNGLYVDEFEKGNKTVVTLSDVSFTQIPDHVFTKAFLENLSK